MRHMFVNILGSCFYHNNNTVFDLQPGVCVWGGGGGGGGGTVIY